MPRWYIVKDKRPWWDFPYEAWRDGTLIHTAMTRRGARRLIRRDKRRRGR